MNSSNGTPQNEQYEKESNRSLRAHKSFIMKVTALKPAMRIRQEKKRGSRRFTVQGTDALSLQKAISDSNQVELLDSLLPVFEPNGTYKRAWDWLIICLAVSNSFFIPWFVAFMIDFEEESPVWAGVAVVIDIFFLMDILLRFRTGYVDHFGKLVLDPAIIRDRYLKSSRFKFDVIAIIPFELLSFLGGPFTREAISRSLKLPKLLRARFLWNSERFEELDAMSVRLLRLLFSFMLCAHWFGCIFFWSGTLPANTDVPGGSWIVEYQLDQARPETQYIASIYWAVTTMTTVGYGDIFGTTNAERIATMITMLLSSIFYSILFGNINLIIQGLDSSNRRLRTKLDMIEEFVKLYKLPTELHKKLYAYTTEIWNHDKGFDMEMLVSQLPIGIKSDILRHLHQNLLTQVPLFKDCDQRFVTSIVSNLKTQVLLSGDVIFHIGDRSREMYFIREGKMAVIVPTLSFRDKKSPENFLPHKIPPKEGIFRRIRKSAQKIGAVVATTKTFPRTQGPPKQKPAKKITYKLSHMVRDPVGFRDALNRAIGRGENNSELTDGMRLVNTLAENEKVVAIMKTGAVFGEISAILGTPRTATLRAITKCELSYIPYDSFVEVLDRFPEYESHLKSIAKQHVDRDERRELMRHPSTLRAATLDAMRKGIHAKASMSQLSSSSYGRTTSARSLNRRNRASESYVDLAAMRIGSGGPVSHVSVEEEEEDQAEESQTEERRTSSTSKPDWKHIVDELSSLESESADGSGKMGDAMEESKNENHRRQRLRQMSRMSLSSICSDLVPIPESDDESNSVSDCSEGENAHPQLPQITTKRRKSQTTKKIRARQKDLKAKAIIEASDEDEEKSDSNYQRSFMKQNHNSEASQGLNTQNGWIGDNLDRNKGLDCNANSNAKPSFDVNTALRSETKHQNELGGHFQVNSSVTSTVSKSIGEKSIEDIMTHIVSLSTNVEKMAHRLDRLDRQQSIILQALQSQPEILGTLECQTNSTAPSCHVKSSEKPIRQRDRVQSLQPPAPQSQASAKRATTVGIPSHESQVNSSLSGISGQSKQCDWFGEDEIRNPEDL